MRVSATDAYRLYRPSHCELRLYLHHQGVEEADPSAFEQVIRRLGQRHEQLHLATFPKFVDVSLGSTEARKEASLAAIQRKEPAIYQPLFSARVRLDDRECELVGSPDLLLEENGSYAIRDVKLARSIEHHPEIIWQLRIYGWLYEQAIGHPPVRLEVYNGKGDTVPVESAAYDDLQLELKRYVEIIDATEAPIVAVNWSKCGSCGYHDRCWTAAERAHDVALVPKVDQGLVLALRNIGVLSYEDLVARFNEDTLARFCRRRLQGK